MNRVRITAIRQTVYNDLMAKYENPIEHTCDVTEGQHGFRRTGNVLKGCVRLHGNPCVNLLSRLPEEKEISTMDG